MRSGSADVVVAEHGDELAARLAHDRVVGLGDPAVGLVTDDPQARVVEAREDLRHRRVAPAVEHHEDLEVAVGLLQAGGNGLLQIGVALVGGDAKGDARVHGARNAGGLGSPFSSAPRPGALRRRGQAAGEQSRSTSSAGSRRTRSAAAPARA